MKKIKIISMLLCIVTVLCAMALTANAKWWDENPFTDVKSSHWYYDAVRICNENDIFAGTSENKYSPSVKMTRAMLVKALANLDGYTEAYKGTTPFTDVKSSHWFATAVEWAYETKVTSGKTDTTFAPNENITREQLAAMLYRYAEYKGMEIANEKDISAFPDASKVSTYAVKNLEWAYGNGIVNGSISDGKTYLNPRNPATRAECATMFSKYLYLEPVYEINGNDLSLYTIVYSATENENFSSISEMSKYLADMIEGATGIRLEVVTDDTPVSEYEILVGKTNREEQGLVSIDRASFEDDQTYVWSVQDNYLVITGIDDDYDLNTKEDKSHRGIKGTRNAVFKFCEEVLGVYEYIDNEDADGLVVYETDPVISLDNGYYHEDLTWYRRRTFYMKGSVNGHGSYIDFDSYNISMWLTYNFDDGDDNLLHESTPCMSDPDHIATIIANVKKYLDKHPTLAMVGIGINDSQSYCRCADCAAIYTKYNSRSATLVCLVNAVSDAIAEDYPGVMIQTGAYEYCVKPPKGIELRDNIVLEFFTVKNCCGHAYTDTTCDLNKSLVEYYHGWDEISDGGCTVWDHSGGFMYFMTPQPDWDSLLANVRFFAEGGAREMLMNSVFYGEPLPNGEDPEEHADLGNIRGYMLSMIYMDPFMSEEEYYYRLDNCLKANCGDGWKYIREYIDIISELGNSRDHSFHTPVNGYYDIKEVEEVADYVDTLWVNAKAQATGDDLARLTMYETSWIYMKQCATYDSRYKNGTDAQRAEYMETSEYLYNCILDMRLLWTEGTLNLLDRYDPATNPTFW
ncbi:MAG: DUF4838 domain-containing protein [Clostridia bacterium]|nr:DUF4838 domain-containing protein [Clostridia bacterium]